MASHNRKTIKVAPVATGVKQKRVAKRAAKLAAQAGIQEVAENEAQTETQESKENAAEEKAETKPARPKPVPPRTIRKPAPESDEQKGAFAYWIATGRVYEQTARNYGVGKRTVFEWARKFNWIERADILEARARQEMEDAIVADRKTRIEQQLKAGTMLRMRGVEWLANNKISTAKDAVAAIVRGVEIERQADGLPTYLMNIATAPLEELLRMREQMNALRESADKDPSIALGDGQEWEGTAVEDDDEGSDEGAGSRYNLNM